MMHLIGTYGEGAIARIKLENFLTYDAVEFIPGPHLNLIIGPNGTGKSSIVCAICLGLGGKTSILGRAKDVGEYIKHGQQTAYIEIELFNPDGDNCVVGRSIQRNNKSDWTVNSRHSTHKNVDDLVARLNIQIGNLCQFLPQEKVADFSKMTQQELLENTEKAIGENELYDNHMILKNAREKGRDLELQFARTKETVEREVALNSRLEQDVKNYKQRQHHLAKIEMLQKKRTWVEYEEKRVAYNEEKKRFDALKDDIRKAREDFNPMKKKLDQSQKSKKLIDDKMKAKTEESKVQARHAAAKSKDNEKHSDEVIELDSELEQIRVQEQRRQHKLRDLKDQLETLDTEYAQLEDVDVQPQLEKNQQEVRNANRKMTQIQNNTEAANEEYRAAKRDVGRLQTELNKLQDVNNQRLEVLRQKNIDTYNAVLWLREHKDLFKATIHEPIMTLINVNDASCIKYIESNISMNDMRAFICEDKEDVMTFLDLVRDKQKLAVNALEMPSKPSSSFVSPKPVSHYSKWGFYSYLREMITCPEPVMRYLCQQWRFHIIPVGNDYTKNNVEAVIASCPELTSFYTSNHQYSLRKSRYGGHTSSRCTEIRQPSLLTVSYDTEREAAVQQELVERQRVMQEKERVNRESKDLYKQLEKQMETLRAQRKLLQEKKGQRRTLQNRIDMKKQSIQRCIQEATDTDKEETRINAKIKKLQMMKCGILKSQMEHTRLCHNASIEKVRLSIKQTVAQHLCTQLDNDMREQSVTLSNLENEVERVKEEVKRTKDEARRLLNAAKRATGTRESEELSEEIKKSFEALPSSMAEIDSMIHEEQARADCTLNTDESVINEYQKRERDIQKLTSEVAKYSGDLEKHQEEIADVKTKWLQPLSDLVERINENFSYFFRCMKCAGEVDLFVPDNPEDYEKYGVRIKVKYRDTEQLRELKAAYQSGGEKSVATVLYMMALQELTKCPFRCVDEINQGMDPNNERRVFELVVKTACRENTSQYFLLTPKLLPDLEYTDQMTVLCVYNGPHMVEWNLKKFLRRRARLDQQA